MHESNIDMKFNQHNKISEKISENTYSGSTRDYIVIEEILCGRHGHTKKQKL